MRRFFNWFADLAYFPGWTLHPVILFCIILALLAGVGVGLYIGLN